MNNTALIQNYHTFLIYALGRDSNSFIPLSPDTMSEINLFIDNLASLPTDKQVLNTIIANAHQSMDGYKHYDEPSLDNMWHFFRDATVELSEEVTGQNTAREKAADVYLELFELAQPNIINVN